MAKNKTLEAARKAYNKSKATKYRVQAGGKKTKKKEQKVKSHYGGVAKKTQNTEENRAEARTKVGSVAKTVGSNVVKGKTTDTKPTTTGASKQNGSRSGAISSVSTKQKERQAGATTARTTAKGVGKTIKKATNVHKAKTEVTDVTQGTARGTGAGSAFNKSKAAEKALEKAGEKKTLTVSKEQLTAEQKAAQERAARQTRFYTNSLVASGRITQKEADDAVKKAMKNASKGVKEDHTLTYSNSAQSNEKVQRVANASKFTNVEVEDKKAKEKAMREARFYTNSQVAAGNMSQKEADKIVKQAGKGHRTTQSANILDKLGGEGEAERQGTRQAGQMNDSKFASGVMQGLSYADNTRAVGKYNEQAAELVDTVKQSGAFNTGYMVGQAGQFMLGGTGKMTDALVKGVAKSGAMRSALNVGLRKGGADILFESPINALDAVKMSTDANGNFDKKSFVKYLALNTGLSGGMGGVIGGIGAKMTKNDVRVYANLSEKLNKNIELTPDELSQYSKIQNKLDNALKGNDRVKEDYINAGKADAVLSKADNKEYMSLLGKEQTGNLTQQERVRLSSYENVVRRNYDEAQNNYAKVLSDAAGGEKVSIKDVKEATEFFERSGNVAKATEAETILETTTKERQLEIIKKTNPKDDSLGDHTWIESADDIKTFDEAINSDEAGFTPDFTKEMADEALEKGEITVYSSKPIEDGAFVTPSKMDAESYAGGGEVFEQTIKTDDVAWLDELQGQVAKISDEAYTEAPKARDKELLKPSQGGSFNAEKPKTETPTETKPKPEEAKPKETETQKLSDNKYASDELKSSVKEIEAAGIYKEEVEKAAKKYNDLDKKIGGLQNRINNAKKKEYPTEAEKTAHIAELEDELRTLRNRQNNVAGEIEQMGKMKAVDNSKTAKEQIRELHGDRSANEELKNADNLKNEDRWIKDKWNSVRRLWEDSLIDVENVAKKTGGELREQILTAANRVRNSMNVANNWITHTRKSFDNKVGGKALDDIFTKELIENESKYSDFQEYLIMKHVPARHEKGTDIYADISPELAEKRVKELEKEYGDEIKNWSNDVYDYLKDLQQYRVDSGLLSKEAADEFAKDYPFYVPTNRVNDETVDFFTGGTSNGIRTAKGGESEVLDMYSQIYTATNKTIHAAEENQMLNLYFKAKGVTDEQIKQYSLKDLEHATINATVNKKTGAAKVSFFIDGKPVEFPCSHQLALGLRELDGLEFERLMKAAKVATLYGKPFKALITDWNLVFGVRNGMRDLQQAVVNSKDTKYFGSSMGAAAHAIADNNSPYRKAYASMGGEQAQLVSYDAVAERMGLEKGRVDKIHEKVDEWVDASVNVKGKDVNTNPIHYIEGINGAIEMMPRMCEFIGTLRKNADAVLKKQGSSVKKLRKEIVAEVEALEKSGKVGASEVGAEVENRLAERILEIAGKDGLDSAMRNANDITLNFGRSGVLGKALNMGFVPYLNPSIQGLSKLVRLFTEAGQEGGWKALASIGMKLGTFTIAPAVWNELALRNNEEYQNLNTRDKDNNFFIALGDGKFIKIPKPRENAVLAEPVEYGLRYFLDKSEYAFFDWDKLKTEDVPLWEKIPLTDEGKQSLRTAVDNIGVINPMTSNMVSPLWQTFHNKTWYGGSIESAYETSINEDTGKANVPVNKRYDTGTSGVAIWLGQSKVAKELNLSPKKIDNILDSYTGMIYDLGISQTTEEAKTRGNYLLRTAASQFLKDSVFSNKLSTKAWEKIDGMSKKEQDEYKSKYMYDAYKYDDAMDAITADKNLTVKEKMEAKRFLQKQRNKLYRAAINGEPNETNPLKDISKYLGANKTLNKFLPKSGDEKYDTWTDYYKNYKKTKGYKGLTPAQKEKEAQKFLDVYTLGVKGQSKVSGDFHDSPSWGMTGVAAAQRYKQGKLSQKDAKTIMESCGVYESQTESYFKYADHGGNVSRYAVTKKNNNKAEDLAESMGVATSGDGSIWKNKYSKEKGIKGGVLSMSLATGKADFKDRAYYISNSGDSNMLIKMNAARGYAEKYGHTTKQLIKLGKKADTDGNTYLSNEEIESACNTIKGGKATSEEKAMGWVLLGGNPNKNPFGAIGDYSHDGDTGITMDDDGKSGGHGRRGRGRRGRRGGGGGGSSKGTMPKTESGAIKASVTDPFTSSNGTSKSNLNDAYRKRLAKLRK